MASSPLYLGKRALIIGINEYKADSLNYCINDARDLSTALQRIGFDINFGEGVEIGINCNRTEFCNIVEKFSNMITKNDLMLFYFAGHGKQVDDDNYLLPSDYDYDYAGHERNYIVDHAINTKYIAKKIEDKLCRSAIYIFDCCRKFVKTRGSDGKQGLSAMNAPRKSLLVYACAPGRVSLDETKNNRNGIFAEFVLRHIEQPSRDIEEIMRQVACEIEAETHGFQLPFRTSSLTHKVCLVENHIQGIPNISANARWKQNGVTVAGGNGNGSSINQLVNPYGVCVDDDQTVIVADSRNHRIVQWKKGDINGQILAGGNGKGNRFDQLNQPTDVLIDKETNSLIIADWGNQRVVRWSRRGDTKQGDILIENVACWGLAMDDERYLYVSDVGKHEVKRYRFGDMNGTLVTGGSGQGNGLNQLNWPAYVFVDRQQNVYVSDYYNNRVMRWNKDAKEGIVVAGGNGEGNALTQLHCPNEIFVDALGTLYVADALNHRIIRWPQKDKQGTVIVGGNGQGAEANQFNRPFGLSFDLHGNLYIADRLNNRVLRFDIIN